MLAHSIEESFDRIAYEVGDHWFAEHADIEDRLVRELEMPAATCAVSVARDRVSVPVEEQARRPVGRPRKNAPKRPVSRRFRKAYRGTVTLHDATEKSLHTIRYGCMPHSDASDLLSHEE